MITTRLGFTAAARAPRTSSARTMRRALVAGPPVLLAAALLGGCGGNGDPTGSGGSSATAMSSTGGGGPATTTTSSGGGAGGGTPELCPETMNTGADRPHVFWPKPVRAYPGIPFLFTLVAYDPDGGALCYGLDGAPAGMSIDARGTITWSPTDADAQKSPSAFKVQITNTRGGRVTVPVSLAVAKSGFLFVAPGGDDASDGSLAKPFATIRHGLDVVGQQKGATLLVRGGTYDVTWNWEVDGVKAPLGGIDFTADDPAEVRGYPGEDVVINCVNGHGLWAYATSYVLFADLAVKNVTVGERGGAISNGNHIVFQRVTVSDSNWADSNNCTGFKLDGTDVVAHRCDAHDNYDRNGHVWNNSNYLVYTDGGMQDVYILESTSEHSAGPGTGVGFKVKHAGPGKLTVFGSRDDGSSYGFGGQDDGTTVRFSTFVNNATAIHLGISDPNEFTKGGMTIEHNTIVNPTDIALSIQTSYGEDGTKIQDNVFAMNKTLGVSESEPQMFFLWAYDKPAPGTGLTSDRNCLFAKNQDTGFRFGEVNGAPLELSFAGWQQTMHDAASVFGDPKLAGANDFRLAKGSACVIEGKAAGAWPVGSP